MRPHPKMQHAHALSAQKVASTVWPRALTRLAEATLQAQQTTEHMYNGDTFRQACLRADVKVVPNLPCPEHLGAAVQVMCGSLSPPWEERLLIGVPSGSKR